MCFPGSSLSSLQVRPRCQTVSLQLIKLQLIKLIKKKSHGNLLISKIGDQFNIGFLPYNISSVAVLNLIDEGKVVLITVEYENFYKRNRIKSLFKCWIECLEICWNFVNNSFLSWCFVALSLFVILKSLLYYAKMIWGGQNSTADRDSVIYQKYLRPHHFWEFVKKLRPL